MGDNNSPILLTDVPQPIATFNKPFELSELVGNLDAIFYIKGVATYSVNCIEISEESSTKYVLGQSAETYFAELSVEGSSLYAKANGLDTYLFDLDFKHQSRKFFELTSGTYAVTLPWLGLDAESKVLVSVSGESSGRTVTIHYVDNDYRAWGYAGGGIREISWFNELLTDTNIINMVTLVDKLINLEYSVAAAGGVDVVSLNTQPTEVTGNWNLFTDGSPFIPLRIISRFPNGSPVLKNDYVSQPVKICSFNRAPAGVEIELIDIVIRDDDNIQVAIGSYWKESNKIIFESKTYEIAAQIIGYDMYIAYDADAADIYDIDYDHQFRRSVPTGFVKMNVQIPQLLNNPSAGQGIGIMHDTEGQTNFGVCTAQDNSPYIVEGNTWTSEKGGWANSLTWANVQSLLQGIIAMEFEGFDVEPPLIDPVEYREALATGFTVTPLIPQTLS